MANRGTGAAASEGRGLAVERVCRQVELLDRTVVAAHDPQQLAALAPLRDAVEVAAHALEEGGVATGNAVDELRLESALPPGEDELVPLRPPASEQRLGVGRRHVLGRPRFR